MATNYHVYAGDHADGPVDYTAAIGTTSSLSFAAPALPLGSITRFGVRAFDTVTGYQEENVDAVVRVVVNSAGVDVTGQPNPPTDLSATRGTGGDIKVQWTYNPQGQGGAPISFKVWATPGGSPNYAASPAATQSYTNVYRYSVTIPSLTDGASYAIAVRATNAAGDETNTTFVQIVADASGPLPPINLAATVTQSDG